MKFAGVFWLLAWYLSSLLNTFSTKIVTQQLAQGETLPYDLIMYTAFTIIGNAMISLITSRCCKAQPTSPTTKAGTMRFKMLLAGCLRGFIAFSGTCTLFYSPVSLVEAFKSTAPIFTLLIAYCIRGESSSYATIASIFPIMVGLAISAGAEIDFNPIGMCFAFINCSLECILNVYTKSLTDTEGPVTVQLYSAFSAAVVLLPFLFFVQDMSKLNSLPYLLNKKLVFPIICSSIGYHSQWMTQFLFMEHVGAVSLSVANVVKRGLIIYLSTIYFSHAITSTGYGGLALMGLGLACYASQMKWGGKEDDKGDAAAVGSSDGDSHFSLIERGRGGSSGDVRNGRSGSRGPRP